MVVARGTKSKDTLLTQGGNQIRLILNLHKVNLVIV